MLRILYIVANEGSVDYEHLFEWLRRDMAADATVELTFDRRRGEGRSRAETVQVERRRADRRRHSVEEELAQAGWARVQRVMPPG